MSYAEGTSVTVEKSKAELDHLLAKAGAGQRLMGSDDDEGFAFVVFTLEKRQVRLRIPLPFPTEKRFTHEPKGKLRPIEKQRAAYEQGCRERWRQLVLLVKAKLEAIAIGISTVEREFLADLYLADGRTVHQAIAADIEQMFVDGKMPKLLLGMGGPTDV